MSISQEMLMVFCVISPRVYMYACRKDKYLAASVGKYSPGISLDSHLVQPLNRMAQVSYFTSLCLCIYLSTMRTVIVILT